MRQRWRDYSLAGEKERGSEREREKERERARGWPAAARRGVGAVRRVGFSKDMGIGHRDSMGAHCDSASL